MNLLGAPVMNVSLDVVPIPESLRSSQSELQSTVWNWRDIWGAQFFKAVIQASAGLHCTRYYVMLVNVSPFCFHQCRPNLYWGLRSYILRCSFAHSHSFSNFAIWIITKFSFLFCFPSSVISRQWFLVRGDQKIKKDLLLMLICKAVR